MVRTWRFSGDGSSGIDGDIVIYGFPALVEFHKEISRIIDNIEED